MSHNLHFKYNGVKLDLYQTPTHISNMAIMTSKGVKPYFQWYGGKVAKRALLVYIEWLLSERANCSTEYMSKEDYDELNRNIEQHIHDMIGISNSDGMLLVMVS